MITPDLTHLEGTSRLGQWKTVSKPPNRIMDRFGCVSNPWVEVGTKVLNIIQWPSTVI